MAFTLTNSNYGGQVEEQIYLITGVGNEVVSKGAAKLYTGIGGKFSLPVMSATADPIDDFVSGSPTSDTVTTSYLERSMTVLPGTLYEEFLPASFLGTLWEKFESHGDLTNLELNTQILSAILDLHADGIGAQISKLFWQGDILLAAHNPLNIHDGIITRAKLDANVIKPTPAGNITAEGFMTILAAVREAIPEKFEDDPDFVLHVNTTDYRVMNAGNLKLKEAFYGVFGMGLEDMYQMKKIKHFASMPRHHIIGAKTTNDNKSNLRQAVWVDPKSESVRVDRVANNSNKWFIRMDVKMDANYRIPTELVLYTPV